MSEPLRPISLETPDQHNKHIIKPPTFTSKDIKEYIKTRFTSLWIGKKELSKYPWYEICNPFHPLIGLTAHQWFCSRFTSFHKRCYMGDHISVDV